jgi:hypothetical protein
MKPSYAHPAAAHFIPSSISTPSGSTSTLDSMSPYTHAAGNAPFPTAADPSRPPFRPSTDRLPELPPTYQDVVGDSGDAFLGFMANNYPTAHFERRAQDASLPPPRPAMSSFLSPAPLLDIPLPGGAWTPYGRALWHADAEFDWSSLGGDGGDSAGRSRPPDRPVEPAQNGLSYRPTSYLSPSSTPLQRLYSNTPATSVPVPESPMGEYDYPKSAVYPGNLYADIAGELPWGDVSGADCARVSSALLGAPLTCRL